MSTYASGQAPKRGDTIQYANMTRWDKQSNPECGEVWIVTSVSDDMVRAKALHKESWRQAFFTAQMEIVEITG